MRRSSFAQESSSGFPMMPMIDIVLQLLIFFMLISRYLPPSLSVSLPEAAASQADNRPSIALSISAEGELMLDGQMTAWEELQPLLLDIAAQPEGTETQVRIAADKGVDYDYVVRALDAAAQAGLTQVALETAPSVPAGEAAGGETAAAPEQTETQGAEAGAEAGAQ